MKKVLLTILLLSRLVIGSGSRLSGQIGNEKVEVVNIEVPVRVLCDGQPLDSLEKKDFQLVENNELQEINGFCLRRKKMNIQRIAIQAERDAVPLPPRYFVLVFRIFQYNEQMQKGIDYLFANILRDQDDVLIMANDRTLVLNRDVWMIGRQEILEQILQEEAGKASEELDMYSLRVQQEIESHLVNFKGVNYFLQNYREILGKFKNKYLVFDADNFYNFARYLQKIKAEKWVLNFFQVKPLPKMKNSFSIRRQIDKLAAEVEGTQGPDMAMQFAFQLGSVLEKVDRQLGLYSGFSAEQIGKMLLQVDSTYHCFISNVGRNGLSEKLDTQAIDVELENSMREITRRTGGELTVSGDIGSALHAIENREDVYYVLTYAPRKPESHGKISIQVKDPRLQLLYDDNLRKDYIGQYLENIRRVDPTVQILHLAFKRGQLHFEVSDFRMAERNKKATGQLKIGIRIFGPDDSLVYDKSRLVEAREKSVFIDIGFDWLEAGRYIFLVEARDLLSDKTAMDVLSTTVD